jgi:hypothetical protein
VSHDILAEARSRVLRAAACRTRRPAGTDLDMLARLKMPIKALSATL